MAGGLRAGASQADPAILELPPGAGAAAGARPVVAAWEGRILAAGPRTELLQALEAGGYPLARFATLDAGGGAGTPGLRDPHTPPLFGRARRGARDAL